jgi:uncharacterized protein YgiB involved in biofilm formation
MDKTDQKITESALPQSRTMRRMMRSRSMHLTSLMATATFSLGACGVPQVSVPEPPPQSLAYVSLDACKQANDIPDAECDTAFANARVEAEKSAPRYASREECEGEWGPDQCQPNNGNTGGGSFFTPLLTGFIVGQMLGGGGYRGGGPLFRDRNGQYTNGTGGYLGTDYRTGRTVARGLDDSQVAKQAPSRAQSRTTVVSRGGFGGGGRGYGG